MSESKRTRRSRVRSANRRAWKAARARKAWQPGPANLVAYILPRTAERNTR